LAFVIFSSSFSSWFLLAYSFFKISFSSAAAMVACYAYIKEF